MLAFRKLSPLVIAGLGLAVGFAACPAGSSSGAKKKDAGAHDAGFAANNGGDDAGVYCPAGSTTFLLETEATGKKLSAKLYDAMPNPPERYNNNWVIDVVDANGEPVADATITKAQVYMPFHQHGRPATWTAMPEPGRFKLALNFFMRGFFEVRLTMSSQSAEASNEYIVFSYCVQE
jgi:hypothetical protein